MISLGRGKQAGREQPPPRGGGLLQQRLQPLGMKEGHDRVFNADPAILAELAESAGDGFPGGAGHGSHLLMGEQQRKTEPAVVQVLADLLSQFHQQPAQARGHGFGQGNPAGILQGETVFLANALHGPHLGFFMGAQKAEKALPFDRAKLGGGQ